MPTYYRWGDTWASWTTASTTTSSNWIEWNATITTSSSITILNDVVWHNWSTSSATGGDPYYQPVPETEEQRAQREERQREQEERRAAAKERATRLLLSVLDEEQAADFLERQEFTVEGSDGKRYLIREGRMHNVFEVDDAGARVIEICGHVRDHVPNEDNLAAQKLALEHDAPGFLRIANRWDLTRGRASLPRAA